MTELNLLHYNKGTLVNIIKNLENRLEMAKKCLEQSNKCIDKDKNFPIYLENCETIEKLKEKII